MSYSFLGGLCIDTVFLSCLPLVLFFSLSLRTGYVGRIVAVRRTVGRERDMQGCVRGPLSARMIETLRMGVKRYGGRNKLRVRLIARRAGTFANVVSCKGFRNIRGCLMVTNGGTSSLSRHVKCCNRRLILLTRALKLGAY